MSLHMAKLFMFLVILAAVLSRSHAAAWGVQLRKQSRDMARPGYPDASEASGTEPIGDYQRKTQAPMVWLSLKKNMVSQIVPTWYNTGFAEEAARTLGYMRQRAQGFASA